MLTIINVSQQPVIKTPISHKLGKKTTHMAFNDYIYEKRYTRRLRWQVKHLPYFGGESRQSNHGRFCRYIYYFAEDDIISKTTEIYVVVINKAKVRK